MFNSTRFVVVIVSVVLTFLFLFAVLAIEAASIADVVVPAFTFLVAVAGGGMATKAIEKSKWSKPNGDN